MDRHLIGGRSSDPFVKLSWNGQAWRSTFKKATLAPFWGEMSTFSVSMADLVVHGTLDVLIEDYDTSGLGLSGGFLGRVKVPLSGLREGVETQAWFPLAGAKGDADVDRIDRGEIELRLMVYERKKGTANPLQPSNATISAFCEAEHELARGARTKAKAKKGKHVVNMGPGNSNITL